MPSITNLILSFWPRLLSFSMPKAKEWDPHGLSDNVVLDLNELREFNRYKVSDVMLIDNFTSKSVDADDPINLISTLKPGGIYTKSQLQEQLQYLAWWKAFETLKLESKTKPDGTIGITIYFGEVCWSAPDRIQYINVGLMDSLECTTSEKEPMETRIDMSRPCMLPASTQREILDMLVVQGKVTPRLLVKFINKVNRWYEDHGYQRADVVDFWISATNELVCEVVEGDITQVVVNYYNVQGVVCEEKPEYQEIRKELGKYLSEGRVYNTEDENQAIDNVKSLGLFSEIEVKQSPDEKNVGGVLIEIILKEMEQQPA